VNQSPASKAIALLIDLAQKGEIDPWDVQVIEVIDRFLDELGLLNNSVIDHQNTDLAQSGQVILWASMLVLLKANTLEQLELEEEQEELEEYLENMEDSEDKKHYLLSNLEQQIRRRTSAPPPKQRKVTLAELITQLQEIAEEIETNNNPSGVKKKRSYTRQEAINTIAKLAHNENLTELAYQLENFLKYNLWDFIEEEKIINLDKLLHYWSEHNQSDSKDKVGIFWALLLLSSQSKVELQQEEFYQDLHISVI
jgi:segregation and condensation protein A